jgi:signal transduction histidine kinase
MRFGPETLRGRLVVIFAVLTVALSTLVAGFVLVRYHSDVNAQLDANLETRLQDVITEVRRAPRPVTGRNLPILPSGEVFAQVLDEDHDILAASPRDLLSHPLLGAEDLESLAPRHTLERPAPPHGDPARLLAVNVPVGSQHLIVIVGTSVGPLEAAERQLERAVGITLAILALLVITAGWVVLGAALRPVRAMVREAAQYSVRRRGGRLSVPGSAELAELARGLNALIERIDESIDHERAFLDDASHELRTPIAIARGELELAALQGGKGPAVVAAVQSALEEIEHLERLAVNLLVLARSRSSEPPADTSVDLHRVATRAVEAVSRTGRDDVEIVVSGEGTATGDELALERAVVNIVENAARNARHRVDVQVTSVNGDARIEVRDDGPGFPPAVLEQAPGRFVHTSPGGTGLGLAIVDAIAAAHGGHLSLRTVDGSGAEVVLEIPVTR